MEKKILDDTWVVQDNTDLDGPRGQIRVDSETFGTVAIIWNGYQQDEKYFGDGEIFRNIAKRMANDHNQAKVFSAMRDALSQLVNVRRRRSKNLVIEQIVSEAKTALALANRVSI